MVIVPMCVRRDLRTSREILSGQLMLITARLTSLAHSVCMKLNFQGLPWSECDGLGNDELLTRFLFN